MCEWHRGSGHVLLPLIDFTVRLKEMVIKSWSKPPGKEWQTSSQIILRHLQQFGGALSGCSSSGGRCQDCQCLSLSHMSQGIRWPLSHNKISVSHLGHDFTFLPAILYLYPVSSPGRIMCHIIKVTFIKLNQN